MTSIEARVTIAIIDRALSGRMLAMIAFRLAESGVIAPTVARPIAGKDSS
jgi:hypothetical protein